MKFQEGDAVIGNKLASENYCITQEGWRGTVLKNYKNGIMKVKELDDSQTFFVHEKCFDLDASTEVNETQREQLKFLLR